MFFEFLGGKLYYKTVGEGIPLLIVHGFAVDYSMMEAALEPVFSNSDLPFRRIYVDLPGMGKSDPLQPEHYADDACDLLSRFMDNLFPEEPYGMISHSYGGYLTRRLIYDHPQRILGSFFHAPVINPMRDDRVVPPFQKRKKDESLKEQYPDLYDAYSETAVVESEYSMQMYIQNVHPVLAALKKENIRFYMKSGYSCSVNVNRLKQPFDRPCVFFLGRQDHIVGTHDSLILQSTYPRADFLLVDDAGHNLFFEQKEFFEFSLKRWLERVFLENN